jgi:hypothetical protein
MLTELQMEATATNKQVVLWWQNYEQNFVNKTFRHIKNNILRAPEASS